MAKIEYISVEKAAEIWHVSARSVRNYCTQGRVPGALLEGKTWKIPSNAEKPGRKTRTVESETNLLSFLKREKDAALKGGIYHKIQIDCLIQIMYNISFQYFRGVIPEVLEFLPYSKLYTKAFLE